MNQQNVFIQQLIADYVCSYTVTDKLADCTQYQAFTVLQNSPFHAGYIRGAHLKVFGASNRSYEVCVFQLDTDQFTMDDEEYGDEDFVLMQQHTPNDLNQALVLFHDFLNTVDSEDRCYILRFLNEQFLSPLTKIVPTSAPCAV